MGILIILKAFIAIGAVLGITIISERKGPKLAGFLSALPIGTVITLFFLGFEIGPQFAAESAIYNMAGLIGLEVLLLCYYLISKRIDNLLLSLISGVAGYAITVLILRQISFEAWQAAGLLALSIPFFGYLFRNIPESNISKKKPISLSLVLFRGIISALVIIAVTEVAGFVGPRWTGLFSGFPTIVLPVLIITHYSYDVKNVHTIIKHIPSGLVAMVVYSLGVWYSCPLIGIYYGTVAAYATVFLYVVAYWLMKRKKT